jgi:hypothetical protein
VVGRYDWLSRYSRLRSTRLKACGWMSTKEENQCSSSLEGNNRMRLVINSAATISRIASKQASQHSSRRGAGDSSQGRADQSGSDVTLPTIEFQYSPVNSQPRYLSHTTTPILADCGVRTPVMPSLILVVFVIQLALHLISTFGGQPINDLVPLTRSHA